MDNITRKILYLYRFLLNKIFKKELYGLMKIGVGCNIEGFNNEKYKKDIVHPCVRYTEKPFMGHKWWLVYTPYYKSDASIENPILCYGDSENDRAPINWQVMSLIRDTPQHGYNSDPTIFFEEDKLYVFWRENHTPRTKKDKSIRATYGIVLDEFGPQEINTPLLIEKQANIDREVSPTIIKHNGLYRAYASHFRFKIDKLHSKNKLLEKIINKLFWLLSLLEIFQEKKSFGIAIWESSTLQRSFKYIKTVRLENCNRLYRPWHYDFFEYDNKLFALVQSNQFNADICLAVSDDYENFRMFSKPLITPESIKKTGIYKPTGLVHNGIFYLYYTAQDFNNRKLNKMYRTHMIMSELLEKLKS